MLLSLESSVLAQCPWDLLPPFFGKSALGSLIFADAPDSVISLLESMAAGAMLTVIAQTMLPEAYAKGGSIVGLSTLLGFLAIIVIKSFE